MSFSQRASDEKCWVLTLQVLPESEDGVGEPGFYSQSVPVFLSRAVLIGGLGEDYGTAAFWCVI